MFRIFKIGREYYQSGEFNFLYRIYFFIFGAPEMGAKIRNLNVLDKAREYDFKTVLDAGCGKAYASFSLAKGNPDMKVTALDINRERLNYNDVIRSKLNLSNLEFVEKDLLSPDLHEKYDLIISVDNLEHIENDLEVLKNFLSILNQKGHLIVQVPKAEKFLFYKSVLSIGNEDHARDGYSEEELSSKLLKAGFEIVEVQHIYNFFESFANQSAMMLSRVIPLYALLLPLITFFSRIPDKLIPVKYRIYNSIQIVAKPAVTR